MGRGLSFEKQQNPFLSSLNRGCIKLSSLRKKTERKWIALPLNSKLDNIRNIKNAITFTSDIILTQCLLPSWGDLQPRDLHQENKLQKPEMEGTFRLIKDWEFSLVLSLTSKGISFNPLSFSRKCPHVNLIET